MGERHGFRSRSSDEAVDSKFCWGTWLEELFEDGAFIRQLEHAAAKVLGGDADVDEVLQEVWLKLLERNRELDGRKESAKREAEAYVQSTVLGTALQFRKRRNEALKRERVGLPSSDVLETSGAGSAGRATDQQREERLRRTLPRDLSPLDTAAVRAVFRDLVRASQKFIAAPVGTPKRRQHYQELLGVLRDHRLISAECYAYMRKHRPESRARRGTATVAALARALSL